MYGTSPNDYFAEVIESMTPGRLLLPAEGEGRNAVFAASLGWEVRAFDYSDAGKSKAMALANEAGVRISYDVLDADTFQCDGAYDVVALVYAHFDPGVRGPLFDAIIRCLRPGGTLMMEVFGEKQLGKPSGGPKDLQLLYSVEEIRTLLNGLHITELLEKKVHLQEGPLHQGEAEVIRGLARKPIRRS